MTTESRDSTEIRRERRALMALNALPDIGPVRLAALLEAFGGEPARIVQASERELAAVDRIGPKLAQAIHQGARGFDAEAEERRLERLEARWVSLLEDSYPEPLTRLEDHPGGLYVRGPYRFNQPAVALVGTRRPTLYGRAVARRLAAELAEAGLCIVSGLARGIDTEAHEGALSVGGATVGVLGCGVDVVYPPESRELFQRVATAGALLSEFPLGTQPDKKRFPQRNRIIAGLCEAVIVVESDRHGGSMITARFAAEYNREVFAVPGRIDQVSSRGCHKLIQEGAALVTGSRDVLEALGYSGQLELSIGPATGPDGDPESRPAPEVLDGQGQSLRGLQRQAGLSPEEQALLECFRGGSILAADQLAELTGLPTASIAATLLMLELKQAIQRRGDGRYEGRA